MSGDPLGRPEAFALRDRYIVAGEALNFSHEPEDESWRDRLLRSEPKAEGLPLLRSPPLTIEEWNDLIDRLRREYQDEPEDWKDKEESSPSS